MSIFHNVAFGLRLNRYKGDIAAKVEQALQGAALWMRSRISSRIRVRRRLAVSSNAPVPPVPSPEPEVLLMDEPWSALDLIATVVSKS